MISKIKLLTVILGVTVIACAIQIGPAPPPSPCQIESLLIDQSLFHQDIYQTGPPTKSSAPMRFGINRIGIGFTSMTRGGAIQDIYEGRNLRETQAKFAEIISYEFSPREDYTDWYIPPTLHYQSNIADQFRYGCHRYVPSGVEICRAIVQYGVYLIIFDADVSDILTHRDIEKILQTIDTKAARCLAGGK